MKTVKQLLEQYDTLVNKQTNENQKLVELVREGLLDEDKLPLIERALSLDSELLTIAEQNAANELLESLITFFILEKKEDGMDALVKKIKGAEDEGDTNYPTNKQAPALLMFQRKAVRVFPDNMRVVVYYSPVLDKYISIPFGGKSLNVTTNINEELSEFSKRVSLSQKRGNEPSGKTDNSWQKKSDESEDEFVRKASKPKHASQNVVANAKARAEQRKSQAKQALVSRATTARKAARYATGSGALRNAVRNNMDKAQSHFSGSGFEHTAALVAGAGTAVGGMAKRAINKVRSKLSEEKLVEAKASYKSIFKMPKAKKRKTSSGPSLDSMFKVSKPKATSSKKETSKATPSKATNSAPAKKENVSDLIQKYRKAHHDHARSTGTTYRVFDSEKGKHVDKNAKTELGDYKERLAKKIRASGSSVPELEEPKKAERKPDRKPPPALAEDNIQEWIGPAMRLGGALLKGGKNLLKRKPSPGAKKLPLSKTRPMPKGRPGGKMGAVGAGAPSSRGGSSGSSEPEKQSGTDRRSHDLAANRNSQGTKTRSPGEPVSRSDAERVKRTGTSSIGTNSVNESHLKTIRAFVKEGNDKLELSYGDHAISINNRLGKKLLSVYESLNADNKLKVETMLNESADSARKVINFVVRN